MRQKSQSLQVHNNLKPLKIQILDYQECLYECVVLRKKFFGGAKRYLYLFPNQIAICKEPNKPLPDRQIPINNETTVSWTHKIQEDSKIYKSVIFHVTNKIEYEYLGNDKVLRDLKENIALYVFQTKIQEEYIAETIIDKGSYATVIELINIYTRKSFAAKCIDQNKILSKHNAPVKQLVINQLQLQYEIQTMRILETGSHPNILKLHELFLGNNNFYIVMELACGGSLLSLMTKRDILFEKKDVKIIMKQLLSGLSYMHSFNLMHRDLKPDNILFLVKDDINSLKIADFGLAQSSDEHPYIYPKCGTPGFVAPEILLSSGKGANYGVECDIFSVGVIFYILLTGEPLFTAKDRLDILDMNRKCMINFDRLNPLVVTTEEKDLLKQMLSKSPIKRPQAYQCLEHCYFNDPLIHVTFPSDLYLCIETEPDFGLQKNLDHLMKNQMICFSKNPFLMKKENQIQLALIEQKSKLLESSFIFMSNLQLGKNSKTSVENLNDYLKDDICGSFNFACNKIKIKDLKEELKENQ